VLSRLRIPDKPDNPLAIAITQSLVLVSPSTFTIKAQNDYWFLCVLLIRLPTFARKLNLVARKKLLHKQICTLPIAILVL
jgi:hypothetical protein